MRTSAIPSFRMRFAHLRARARRFTLSIFMPSFSAASE
jgi:hypothetical protein